MLEELNHPAMFMIFMLMALWGLAAVFTHASKRMGLSGPAAFFQHP